MCIRDRCRAYEQTAHIVAPQEKAERGTMVLPPRDTDDRRVFAYLTKTRKIDPEIVQTMMKQAKVYQSRQEIGGKVCRNCAFVGYDSKGTPRSVSYTHLDVYKRQVVQSVEDGDFSEAAKKRIEHMRRIGQANEKYAMDVAKEMEQRFRDGTLNYHYQPEHRLYEGGPKAKFRNNGEAIRLLKQ